MRFGSPRLWLGAAGALGGALFLWRKTPVVPAPEPEQSEAVQPETNNKAPLGTLLAGALVMLALLAVWFGYQAWSVEAENEQVARVLTGGDPAGAPDAITRYGCGGCHTISGIPGADGQVAPPLTNLRSRVFIGGVLRNTPENLIAWIVDPQAHSPHSAMPNTGISEKRARDVAAYLYAH